MTAAISIAEQGFPVNLIEKSDSLGGNLKHVFFINNQKDPKAILNKLIAQISNIPIITVHLNSQIVDSKGFTGNFVSTVEHCDGLRAEIQHGATILAFGGEEYRGTEYEYGRSDSIITQLEFEQLLSRLEDQDSPPNEVVMFLCIGPAEHYCSRLCCTTALKNALKESLNCSGNIEERCSIMASIMSESSFRLETNCCLG